MTCRKMLAALACLAATPALAENPMVGGAPMLESRNIVENAVNSADHTTLVAALKAAGLVDALQSDGPFTVFAPVNAAFDALPPGTVETLLQPGNKDKLTKILTAHVVSGDLSGADLRRRSAAAPGGYFHMTTLSGDALSATVLGDTLYIVDETGMSGTVTIGDVDQSNGVIHVIDKVLLPK